METITLTTLANYFCGGAQHHAQKLAEMKKIEQINRAFLKKTPAQKLDRLLTLVAVIAPLALAVAFFAAAGGSESEEERLDRQARELAVVENIPLDEVDTLY